MLHRGRHGKTRERNSSSNKKKAREEREKGHKVKVGYQRIQINGKWETWEDIATSAAYKPMLQNNQNQPTNPKGQAQPHPRSLAATSPPTQPLQKSQTPSNHSHQQTKDSNTDCENSSRRRKTNRARRSTRPHAN